MEGGEILGLLRIGARVEQTRTRRIDVELILQTAVLEAEKSDGIVRIEERHPGLRLKERCPFVAGWYRQADEVENRWSNVEHAGDVVHRHLPGRDAWNGEEQRDPYVFVVDLQRVAEIAIVLSEGLTVIAEHDEDRLTIETTRSQSLNERS